MRQRRSVIRILFVLLMMSLTACTTLRYEMRYGVEEIPATDLPQWPPAPSVPRFVYAGMLVGDNNFVVAKDDANRSALRSFFDALFGIGRTKNLVNLARPQSGIVGADGTIYVSDVGRSAVFAFDGINGKLEVIRNATGGKTFISPIGMALGADDTILIADADLGFVAQLTADGTPLQTLGAGLLKRPTGLARDPEHGLIYVSDTYDHLIKIFDDFGNLIETIGSRGSGEGQFNFPTHLAFHNGRLYVTDTMNARVQVFDSLGNPVISLGNRGIFVGEFVRPKGVAVDSEENIYVIESYNDHLLIYNNETEFLLPIGGTGSEIGQFYLPGGMWIDKNNRIFVADTFNSRVVIFQFLGGG